MTALKEQAVEASVKAACKELHLPSVGSRAASLATEASRANHGHLAYLGALLEAELEDRADRRRHRRISEARFPRLKRLEDFEFAEAPQIPAATIADLATCGFVDRAETVIFLGEPGDGEVTSVDRAWDRGLHGLAPGAVHHHRRVGERALGGA